METFVELLMLKKEDHLYFSLYVILFEILANDCRSVQRGRIEYEGETSVYTQISPLKIRGKDEHILIFPGEKLVYTHFSGGKNE
jgi:hypothetical protein